MMDAERFDYLINGYFDGELSSAECDELDALIISDSAAREAYWSFALAHADLRAWGEQRAGQRHIEAAARRDDSPTAAPMPLRSHVWMGLSSWGLSTVAAALVLVSTVAVVGFLASGKPNAASPQSIANGDRQVPSQIDAARSIARMVRAYDCVWSDDVDHTADRNYLMVGDLLELQSGLAEIEFDCGARLILQGPASLLLDSSRAASLYSGKVTVRAETATAKGFAVRTPGMKTIDLGTEFGLEVSRTGIEQVHVFRGEVRVVGSSKENSYLPPHLLREAEGIEVNPSTGGVKLVANNGERFARSLDEAQIKRHVVAYWRFEDHAVDVLVPESKEGKAPIRGSLDSSINGNDLYSWSSRTQPRFSGDVPDRSVPQSGEANTASLDNSTPPADRPTRDLFTMSYWSRPSRTDVQTITPPTWTIEASIKVAKLQDRFQTFLVRDGMNVSKLNPAVPPLAFQVTPERHVKVLFCDVERRFYEATAEGATIRENHWYHVAATSDGRNLNLYVDSLDGKGYVLWAVTGLATSGSTALARGNYSKDDPLASPLGGGYPYIWSVGRGYYNGHVTEWFQGRIDEVRICDTNLEPTEFLFAPRAVLARSPGATKSASAERKRGTADRGRTENSDLRI